MMTNQTIPSFDAIVAPVVAFNKIALSYTEKLVDLNLTVLRKQADIALTGWHEALAVKDADSVKSYLTHQSEVARNVVEGYVADTKAVTQLNQEAAAEVRKVVEGSLSKIAKQAA